MQFSQEVIVAILSLQVVVLASVIGGILRNENRLTKMEVHMEGFKDDLKELKQDHGVAIKNFELRLMRLETIGMGLFSDAANQANHDSHPKGGNGK